MFRAVVETARRFWRDESGSVVAVEYMALGAIVAMGSTAGMVAMRDATVDEMAGYGQSVRTIRQQS